MNKEIHELKVADPNVKCCFCGRHEVNAVEWGQMYRLKDVVLHYFCMLFSAGLEQRGEDHEGMMGFMPKDIWKEVRRGTKLKCKFCKKDKATVGCCEVKCKTSFHYTCGFDNGCLYQFYDAYMSYCPKHRKLQSIPKTADRMCPICMCEVEGHLEAVWPPCCGKSLFHRNCIMHAAKEAGYFFKCPLCNDSAKFLHAMKANGVYVPEQDAAWETVPGAFQELVQSYSTCDAENCLCLQGRDFDDKAEKAWKIVRCSTCGSSATHMECSGLKVYSWKCKICDAVLQNSTIGNLAHMSIAADDSDASDTGNSSENSDEDNVLEKVRSVRDPLQSSSEYEESEAELPKSSSDDENEPMGLLVETPQIATQLESETSLDENTKAEVVVPSSGEGKPPRRSIRRRRALIRSDDHEDTDSDSAVTRVQGRRNRRDKIGASVVRESRINGPNGRSSPVSTTPKVSLKSLKKFFQNSRYTGVGGDGDLIDVEPTVRHGSRVRSTYLYNRLAFERKLEQLRQCSIEVGAGKACAMDTDREIKPEHNFQAMSDGSPKRKSQVSEIQQVLKDISMPPAIDVMKLPRIPKKIVENPTVVADQETLKSALDEGRDVPRKLHQSRLDSWIRPGPAKHIRHQRPPPPPRQACPYSRPTFYSGSDHMGSYSADPGPHHMTPLMSVNIVLPPYSNPISHNQSRIQERLLSMAYSKPVSQILASSSMTLSQPVARNPASSSMTQLQPVARNSASSSMANSLPVTRIHAQSLSSLTQSRPATQTKTFRPRAVSPDIRTFSQDFDDRFEPESFTNQNIRDEKASSSRNLGKSPSQEQPIHLHHPSEQKNADSDDECVEIVEEIANRKVVDVVTVDSDSDSDVVYEETVKSEIPKCSAFTSMLSKPPIVKGEKEQDMTLVSDDDDIEVVEEITTKSPPTAATSSGSYDGNSNSQPGNRGGFGLEKRGSHAWAVLPRIVPESNSNVVQLQKHSDLFYSSNSKVLQSKTEHEGLGDPECTAITKRPRLS